MGFGPEIDALRHFRTIFAVDELRAAFTCPMSRFNCQRLCGNDRMIGHFFYTVQTTTYQAMQFRTKLVVEVE